MDSGLQSTASLPISALQHLLFCPRQCALIHLEQAWEENRFTAEGRVMHDCAHEGPDEKRPGIRITRGLPVRSERLSIHGVCDIVEFHGDGRILPVEYKRGKPKAHRADEVQLCAQALCLEEILRSRVDEGCLFYGEPRRRTVVQMDTLLRSLTEETIGSLHELIRTTALPPAIYARKKCDSCSLIEICQPKTATSIALWWRSQLTSSLTSANPDN